MMMSTPHPRRIAPLTLVMLSTMLAAALVFTLWPEIDLAVSANFYRPDLQDFTGNHSSVSMAIYRAIPMLSRLVIAVIFLAFLGSLCVRGPRGRGWRIRMGFLAAALALVPGLFIDVALKGHWGRARPVHVVEFGGEARFTPAFQPTDQCAKNCSFVSGHASAGFFFVSFGFLGGAVARRRWTLIGLVLGSIAGIGRISQGGHFLSDIVFAFYFTWFSVWLIDAIFQKMGWFPPPPRNAP